MYTASLVEHLEMLNNTAQILVNRLASDPIQKLFG